MAVCAKKKSGSKLTVLSRPCFTVCSMCVLAIGSSHVQCSLHFALLLLADERKTRRASETTEAAAAARTIALRRRQAFSKIA